MPGPSSRLCPVNLTVARLIAFDAANADRQSDRDQRHSLPTVLRVAAGSIGIMSVQRPFLEAETALAPPTVATSTATTHHDRNRPRPSPSQSVPVMGCRQTTAPDTSCCKFEAQRRATAHEPTAHMNSTQASLEPRKNRSSHHIAKSEQASVQPKSPIPTNSI